jgi:predicted metal-dependent HD superfamily phosphohydrolase
METDLILKSKSYAEDVLSQLPESYAYHNLTHTQTVVAAAEEIGRKTNLSNDDLETVVISAWLHDVGYLKGAQKHELVSAQKAVDLLTSWGASPQKIEKVKKTIEATQMPQRPNNVLEQVLCDADLIHLSNDDIEECSDLLRREMAEIGNLKFESDKDWTKFNLQFLKAHKYFTPYGQQVLEEGKKKNLKKLKKMSKNNTDGSDYVKDLEKQLSKLQKKLDKKATPDRGIETMFRVASENHTTLSGMADTKSNIMISINSILISVVVTVFFNQIETYPVLLMPTLFLIFACLLTIIFAVLATRPNLSNGKFTKDDIANKKTNLLFFGNFHDMELAQYDWGMREMMKDADYLYGSLIKDLYFNGKVLNKKYKLLRISYTIFLFGFVLSIIGFTIALLMHYNPR